MNNYLAIDLGGTYLKYGLVAEDASIIANNKIKTPKTLEQLINTIGEWTLLYKDVVGIAISTSGAVSETGIIYGSSAVTYIHGPNIKELIKARTELPVYIGNDANCAGYAEVWNGSAKGKEDVIVMVIGTGIGGSIIKNGRLHKGANLHGGEIGYMLLTSDYTNSDDVWSRVASTRALVKRVAKVKQIDADTLTGEEVFDMAASGDKDCIEAVDRFYHLLAIGIYNLQYIYDPEIILIGGGISARKDLIENINKKIDRILGKVNLAKIKPTIHTCKHRENANLLGAVYGMMIQRQSELEDS